VTDDRGRDLANSLNADEWQTSLSSGPRKEQRKTRFAEDQIRAGMAHGVRPSKLEIRAARSVNKTRSRFDWCSKGKSYPHR
jgi:hypothetical protein